LGGRWGPSTPVACISAAKQLIWLTCYCCDICMLKQWTLHFRDAHHRVGGNSLSLSAHRLTHPCCITHARTFICRCPGRWILGPPVRGVAAHAHGGPAAAGAGAGGPPSQRLPVQGDPEGRPQVQPAGHPQVTPGGCVSLFPFRRATAL
jgi:hypothetical protein